MDLPARLRAGSHEPTREENIVRVVPASQDMLDAADRIEALEAALRRAREQILDQQVMPDEPTWIDEILANQK